MTALTINCDECAMQHTDVCDDCVVSFICEHEAADAIVFDAAEERAIAYARRRGIGAADCDTCDERGDYPRSC